MHWLRGSWLGEGVSIEGAIQAQPTAVATTAARHFADFVLQSHETSEADSLHVVQ